MGFVQYVRWEDCYKVLEKAKGVCKNSNINVEDHFRDVTKMVVNHALGSLTTRLSHITVH
ncbi:hypothetical protein JCM15765_21180 [Paradesulfitobacterium aromaticivorans]